MPEDTKAIRSDTGAYIKTPDGWKPAEWIEYDPPEWYMSPLIWLAEKLFAQRDKVHDTKGVLKSCRS